MRCAKIPSTARNLPQKHRRLKYSAPYSQLTRKYGSDIPIIIQPTIFIRVHSVHAVGRIRLGARKLPPPPYRETRFILHAKWSNFQNTQQYCTKFSGMLGEDVKMIREKFCEFFQNSDRANWKKATPRIW